jgi:hypothetical protein
MAVIGLLQGCNTTSETDSIQPPDAKAAVLAHKNRLWKDADSIKAGAGISAPTRHMGFMWHVCVRANARNSFGGYAGEKEALIGLYDDGRPPEALLSDAAGACYQKPYTPFPELEGGYRPPAATPQDKAKRS